MSHSTRPTEALTQAQEKTDAALRQLEQIRDNLLETVDGVPLPLSAHDLQELRELSGLAEIDAVVRCAVQDHLDPAIRDLRELLAERDPEPPQEEDAIHAN